MRTSRKPLLLAIAVLLAWTCGQVGAQTMLLRQAGTNLDRVTAQIGQTITIEVVADLQSVTASGVSFFLTIPDGPFQVVDEGLGGQVGTQPFVAGPLFQGAGQYANALLPETDDAAALFPGLQLEYAALVGAGGDRGRSGAGVLATFSLLCVQPVHNGQIKIDDNAARETRLVLLDGITEQRFRTTRGMEITVTGLELRDVPDVILLPDQADTQQIGSLDLYVQNAFAPIASIVWSYEPANPEGLTIEIDPGTRAVTVTPDVGWSGRHRITWTATEPEGLLPGHPPLSANDFSDILVNNPPSFTVEPDVAGVKRDTLRFQEDQHPFIPGASSNDPRQAFRGPDLDLLVADPDVVDPQTELLFVVLLFGAADSANIRADDDGQTHELLVWSRPDFSGTDSLRVVVNDGLRGQDTLRVITIVAPIPDPPRFILEDTSLRISRGGTKIIAVESFIADADTPIDDLLLEWDEDPGAHFTAERVGGAIVFKGKSDYIGDGLFVFRVRDPLDPDNLWDRLVVNITAAEALPPEVTTPEIKIDLTPPGFEPAKPVYSIGLDDIVEDPDNQDSELAWVVPPVTASRLDVDQNRFMSVQAPLGFVGYERLLLTVTDPTQQSDLLKLRIYSSDGRPVAGGLPDLVLDRGELHQGIDLDNYYFDADNIDEEMDWDTVDFVSQNLLVTIDPVTHIVAFTVPEEASFKTELVVFRVTSRPEGLSALDSVLVSITSGPGETDPGSFQIKPLPEDLQAPVERFTDLLDLDDFVKLSPEITAADIRWEVAGGESSIARINSDHILSVYGISSGLDTLLFTARDTLGRTETASTSVRLVGESEVLRLQSIPDINFVANQVFRGLKLNQFVIDPETHPDSVLVWSVEYVAPDNGIFIQVNPDTTVFATASDTGQTEVVFAARDTALNVVGRDTVRVISLDPDLQGGDLKDLPTIAFMAGAEDHSVILDDYLPDDWLLDGGVPPSVQWIVSGQRATLPVIDPQPPHQLTLSSVGDRVGMESLVFTAALGGGFSATDTMDVTVLEPVDESTLTVAVIPNPLLLSFMDVYVVARRALAGTPIVLRSVALTPDSTVALRQIEDDLAGLGVLLWAGSVELPASATGDVIFSAQALTALGTNVADADTVTIAAAAAGKPVVLDRGGVVLRLASQAVPDGTRILLQTQSQPKTNAAAKVGLGQPPELEFLMSIDAYPAGLQLLTPGLLQLPQPAPAGGGIYRRSADSWVFLGPASGPVEIAGLGRHGLLADGVPPQVIIRSVPASQQPLFEAALTDDGSGIDAGRTRLELDGREVAAELQAGRLLWRPPQDLATGVHSLSLRARDRAGNEAVKTVEFEAEKRALPSRVELGANYPNPFNPETIIPFALPVAPSGGQPVRLAIYNVAGQLVRLLLEAGEHQAPGHYQVHWDGRDAAGRRVGAGVYLYRLEAGASVRIRRMMLLK